ncbi:MAG: 7-cyano-7-deazaguanine synthase [Thermoguttaceae bacterium]|nr:7-cyano-7-deazaguanine synthase [Thermoguttaceae bacterium]
MRMAAGSAANTIGLMLSGGLDSCILLGHLLGQGRRVQPFFVCAGLIWENAEFRATQRYCQEVASPGLEPLVVFDLPAADLYGAHWSTTGRDVPGAQSADEAVFLPGRNALLTIKPLLWCAAEGIEELAIGVLRSNPFPDATPEFFESYAGALAMASGRQVRIVRPFSHLGKREVMLLGRAMPLRWTFCCIAPVDGRHCGRCNKCAERRAAFHLIDTEDPTDYAYHA